MAKSKKTGSSRETRVDADLWQRQMPWRRHAYMVLTMVLLSIIFFAPIHFSGKKLVGSDTVGWRAQAESMIEYREETGQEPLWATNLFGGMPGYYISYENAVPQIDSVARVLRKVIWPSSHFIFLLIGTYVCGFLLTRNDLASLFGAVAYGFTTYIPVILSAGHNTKFVTIAFAPWMMAAFIFTLRKPGLIGALLFGVSSAAVLRGDHVQIAYYFAIIGFIWWLVEGVALIRAGESRRFLTSTLWLALGAAAALLMVAQPYLPALEYKEFTIRGTGSLSGTGAEGLDWSYAMGWSQGRLELLTLLIANAFGGSSPEYWGAKIFTSGPHYLGIAAAGFAGIALIFVRTRMVAALGISLAFVLAFSLGENLAFLNHLMFDFFPMFSAFRVPETWLIAAVFIAALLGAVGMNYALQKWKSEDGLPRAIYVFAGLGALLLLLLIGKSAVLPFEKPNERARVQAQIAAQNNVPADDPRVASSATQYLEGVRESRQEAFTKDAARSLIIALAIGLLLFLYYRGKLNASVVMALAIGITVIDLTTVARRYLSEEDLVSVSSIEDTIPEYAFDTYIKQQIEQAGGPGHFRVLSLEGRGDPLSTSRPSYFYESISGYHAAKLQIYQDYLERLLIDSQGLPSNIALDLMNVRYVVARGQIPGFETVFTDEQNGHIVQERDYFVPRAYFVSSTRHVPDAGEALELLRSGSINIWSEALVDSELDLDVVEMDSSTTALAQLESFGPREIRFNTTTDARRLLVVSEVYYPAGWKAFVDGEETPIVRTNYLLRGVVVPEGEHEVVLKFEPVRHKLGVWITSITTIVVYLLLIVLALRWWMNIRQDQLPDSSSN